MRDGIYKGRSDKNFYRDNISIDVNIDKLNREFKEITNGVHNVKHKSKPHTRDKGKKHKEKDN